MCAKFDFIVVGAGPGGSFAAKVLAQRGFDTLLLEKEQLPRRKPCGGWVTRQAWESLGWGQNTVRNFIFEGSVIIDPLLRRGVLSLSNDDHAIFREEFDHRIALDAADAGAVVHDGERARSVQRANGGVTVRTDRGAFTAQAVIGAEGTATFTGRQLGLRGPFQPNENVFTMSKQIRLSEQQLQDISIDHQHHSHVFMTDYAIGYGWLTMHADCLNMGIGHPAWLLNGRPDRKRIWKRFSQDLIRTYGIPEKHQHILARPRHYAYPSVRGPTEPTFGERVLLIGDAAGFSQNMSGEGIGPAIETGKMAAAALEHAHGKEDFSAQALAPYEVLWKKRMQAAYDSTYQFLRGYISMGRVRHWVNRNALDFLSIYQDDPVLMRHLAELLTTECDNQVALHHMRSDIPVVLLRFIRNRLRQQAQ